MPSVWAASRRPFGRACAHDGSLFDSLACGVAAWLGQAFDQAGSDNLVDVAMIGIVFGACCAARTAASMEATITRALLRTAISKLWEARLWGRKLELNPNVLTVSLTMSGQSVADLVGTGSMFSGVFKPRILPGEVSGVLCSCRKYANEPECDREVRVVIELVTQWPEFTT